MRKLDWILVGGLVILSYATLMQLHWMSCELQIVKAELTAEIRQTQADFLDYGRDPIDTVKRMHARR